MVSLLLYLFLIKWWFTKRHRCKQISFTQWSKLIKGIAFSVTLSFLDQQSFSSPREISFNRGSIFTDFLNYCSWCLFSYVWKWKWYEGSVPASFWTFKCGKCLNSPLLIFFHNYFISEIMPKISSLLRNCRLNWFCKSIIKNKRFTLMLGPPCANTYLPFTPLLFILTTRSKEKKQVKALNHDSNFTFH